MKEELRKRLEEAAKKYQEEYETTERVAFTHGAVWGYKEAVAMAKEWLIGHIITDVECNENGEPLAKSYIEGRKLAIEIATYFESGMNKLWEE